MYLTLFHATEQAINTLITAQRECGEQYISAPEIETVGAPTNGLHGGRKMSKHTNIHLSIVWT